MPSTSKNEVPHGVSSQILPTVLLKGVLSFQEFPYMTV